MGPRDDRTWAERARDALSAFIERPAPQAAVAAPQRPKSWWDRAVKPHYQTAEAILSLTFIVGALTAGDMMIAIGLLGVGYAFALTALLSAETVTQRMAWSIPLTVIFVALGLFIFNRHVIDEKSSASPTTKRTSAAESAALDDLNNWLCVKDEVALRQAFDFTHIVQDNIDIMSKHGGPLTEKDKLAARIFPGFNHIKIHNRPLASGVRLQGGDWTVNPGEVGFIVVSDKYESAVSKLTILSQSAVIPTDVSIELLSLRQAVLDDSTILIEIFNSAYKANPKLILEGNTPGKYYAAVEDVYFARMVQLRPITERLCSTVRYHLQSDVP